jgi:transposase
MPCKNFASPLKKTLHAAEQKRPDVVTKRAEFDFFRIAGIDPHRLIFLDETWIKTNMTRLWGWGPEGKRIVDEVPHGHWMTTTFLAALRSTGLFAPLVIDGPLNGEIFRNYVQQQLAPQLKSGDIVIMDNLASHKVSGVADAIRSAGAELVYLPPYSPDKNPIEMVFSKVKSEIRKRMPRTKPECDQLCGESLDWFSETECFNYIRHAGYTSQQSN